MAFRLVSARYRIKELLDIMSKDTISTQEKLKQLRQELYEWYGTDPAFKYCTSMGKLVKRNLKQPLRKTLLLMPRAHSRNTD